MPWAAHRVLGDFSDYINSHARIASSRFGLGGAVT